MCQRWQRFLSFAEDMLSSYKRGLTLERIDNGKGYSKGNCRWATRREQMLNTRRTRMIEHNGQKMCIADWAKKLNLCHSALRTRIELHGITVALTKEKHCHAH